MAVQTAVSVIIGAELGGTFSGAFASGQKQLDTLGRSIKQLNTTSENVNAFKELRQSTLQARQQWTSAEAEVKRLAKEIQNTDRPSRELNNSFRNAKKDAAIAKSAYQQNKAALRKMSTSLKAAGVDTKNLTQEQNRLGHALDILRQRQTALAAVESKRQANLSKRSMYRSQMMDVVALGTSLYGLVRPAVAFESAMADVKKVVNFETPQQVREMENDIKNLSKRIPLALDGLAQIVAAGGQLGVPREKLTEFAETAAKMSVAFSITADEAGQSMAKMSNVLQMPIDQMSKVGDVINHISNNIAATAPEIVEVNLRAGAMAKSFGLAYNEISALAGTFVSLGKTPEIASTAINMMASRLKLIPVSSGAAREAFDQLNISMAEYTEMVESGRGKDALMTVLEALKNVSGIKRSQIMKEMFGEQATRHLNSLVEGLDSLKSNLNLVANEADYANSMHKEFTTRSATTENNLQLLKNQMAVLATNIGSTMLPTLNTLVGIFGRAASSLADFAERHPTLIKYIGLAVAGMMSFRLSTFALGYGFTFIKGGILSVISIFTRMRTAFSLIRLGFTSLIPIIRSVGAAFVSNPIGLIITGIAVGAALIIRYWKPISAFFRRIFEPVVQVFKNVWDWITSIWEKAKDIFSGIKDWVKDSWIGKAWNWAFGETPKSEPPEIGRTVVENVETTPPAEIPRSTVTSTSTQTNVSVNAPITINASEGATAEQIAQEVSRELNAREQAAQRRQRSVNYD
ncbi:MAG: phage tail tape measure protein [Alphaproteobacteria bacterium]|nr:phage tail tape measure protein [Alphaproteobacteria bacterium]